MTDKKDQEFECELCQWPVDKDGNPVYGTDEEWQGGNNPCDRCETTCEECKRQYCNGAC